MHKIIPYILTACCLCMVVSCDTVFDVHPYDVQIDGDRNLNVTNIQKIEAAVKSKDTIRFAMISDSHQWLDDLKKLLDAGCQPGRLQGFYARLKKKKK